MRYGAQLKSTEMKTLVTKEWLTQKIKENPPLVIGRALVALFHYQTSEERENNGTKYKNGVGFSSNDGRIGALGAKYFLKHGTLLDWQLKAWIKPDKKGLPRIVKYSGQLNKIAIQKKINKSNNGLSSGVKEAIKIVHSGQW